MRVEFGGISVTAGQSERYCRNIHLSFFSSILVSAALLIAMWTHVSHGLLFVWVGLLLFAQGGQLWHSMRYMRGKTDADPQQIGWLSGLSVSAIATGLAWGVSFFILGVSEGEPVAVLMIFILAGITAYAGVAKSDVFPLAVMFEVAAILPMCVWLFLQDSPISLYMGIIGLLYLMLLSYLLRQISSMAQRMHSLAHENSDLEAALTRVQQLEREGAMLRDMIDMIADPAIIVHDPAQKGRIVYVNEAACKHLRTDHETFYTLRYIDFDTRIDKKHMQRISARLTKDGRFSFQSMHRRLDGENVPVEVVLNQFRHAGAELVVTFVRDITTRLAEEERIRELKLRAMREHEFRSLAENMPDPIIRYAPDGTRRYVNPAFEHFFGISLKEAVGRRVIDNSTLTDPESYAAKVLEAAEGKSLDFDVVTTAFARPRTYRVHLVPEMDDDQTIKGVLAICHDLTDIKEAQQQMELLEMAIDGSNDAIFLVSQNLRFRYVNATACQTLRFHREELLEMTPLDIDPSLTREGLNGLFAQTMNDEYKMIETRHRASDGQVIPMEVSASPVEYKGEWFSLVVARDISERKRMEKVLAEHERELSALAESSPGMMASYHRRPDGTICMPYASPNIHELFGISPEAVRDDIAPLTKLIHPDDLDSLRETIAESGSNMSPWHQEYRILHPTRGERWMEGHTNPLLHLDGGVIWYGYVHDITERKHMQEALTKREREFRSLTENIPDNIVRWDRQGRYMYVNSVHARALMQSPEDIVGKSIREVFGYSAQFERAEEGVAQVIATGKPQRIARIEVPDEQGKMCFHDVELVPEFDDTGEIVSVLGIGRDQTETYRMQEALARREQDFRSLADNMPINIARWDTQGYYLYINPVHERTLGKSSEEVVGTMIPDMFSDVKAAVSQVATTGEAIHTTRQSVIVNGFEELHDVTLEPEFDDNGRVVSVLGLGRNMTEYYRLQEAVEKREQEFRNLAESSPDNIIRYDLEQRILYLNDNLLQMLGLGSVDDVIGKKPDDFDIEDQFPEITAASARAIASGRTQRIESTIQLEDDTRFHQIVVVPERDAMSEVVGTIAFGRDVTELKRIGDKLAEREREFRTLVENSADTVARYDRELRCLYANPAFGELVEGGEDALIGQRPSEVPGGEGGRLNEAQLVEVFANGEAIEFEMKWVGKSGEAVYSLINLTPEFNKEDQVETVLAVGRDISELYAFREKIHQMAFYDSLTSLPNRALFNERLCRMIADASWHGQLAAVMMIDMDHFKAVNDTMGHAVGDELLRETSARLSAVVRTYDTVARLGGDEFAVLLPDVRNAEDLGRIADNMRSVFKEPFLLEGKDVFVSCSIGAALYPNDSDSPEDLLKYADSAMYHAKRSGRNNFRFYSQDLTKVANERLMMESELRRAMEREELELYYQPKVRLADGEIIGSEALLRWNHSQIGMIPPDRFISVAEDSGLIIEIGEWVLLEACRMACEMNGAEKPLHKVAINLSARQFLSNDMVTTVDRVLEETACHPEWIELEITESLLLDEHGNVLDTLNAFHARGITIAIDDFGTGYSSLSYLARFPIDTLKIDRTFINTMTTDNYRSELVKAIISIADCLGQQVVAEGVETPEQAQFLQIHQCRVAQGYLFSKPVPRKMLLKLSKNFELTEGTSD